VDTPAWLLPGDVFNVHRRLVSWSMPGGSGKEADDGAGRRVAHQTTSGVTSTTTYCVGGLEEVDAASGAVTKYYPTPAGTPAALRVGTGAVTYLATDGLGSVSAALDGSGNVTATQLFGPYGQTRYTTGAMPTTKGYTGQRADAASGLDYYNARYYDPATDQFVSADSAGAGLNRYAYVAGNPETATDPTGHRMDCGDACTGGGSGGPDACDQATCPRPHVSTGDPKDKKAKHQPPDAKPVNPGQFAQACMGLSGSHPGWCSRYFTYEQDGAWVPRWAGAKTLADFISTLLEFLNHDADFFWFMVSLGPVWGGVEGFLYFIPRTGQWFFSAGLAAGMAVGVGTGPFLLEAGFGMLLTEGTPSTTQIDRFISGLTVAANVTLLIGDAMVFSPSSGMWAWETAVANGFDFSVGAGWSWQMYTPPPACHNALPPLPPGWPGCNQA
jgi:RHS repeat-associated protein